MRETWLRLLLILLLSLMWIFHLLVWVPVKAAGTRMAKQLDALELALLMAGSERRTRDERGLK